MQKLNDAQRKQVEENLHLVRYVIFRRLHFEMKPHEVDDYLQIGAVGLCKAALTFREDSGASFKTYAVHCIRNEVLMEWQKLLNRQRQFNLVSYEQSATRKEDDPPPSEFIAAKEDIETTLRHENLNRMIREAPGRERSIIKRYIAGYTQEEIGRAEGVSQSYSSRLIRRFRRRVEEEHMNIA